MNTTSHRRKKTTAAGAGLPSVSQVIALALAAAEYRLTELLEARSNDEHWNDDDVDVDNAIELALIQVGRMKGMPLQACDDFDTPWFLAAAAVNLAEKAFSRKDCYYARALASTVELFRVHAEAVDFVGRAARPTSQEAA